MQWNKNLSTFLTEILIRYISLFKEFYISTRNYCYLQYLKYVTNFRAAHQKITCPTGFPDLPPVLNFTFNILYVSNLLEAYIEYVLRKKSLDNENYNVMFVVKNELEKVRG